MSWIKDHTDVSGRLLRLPGYDWTKESHSWSRGVLEKQMGLSRELVNNLDDTVVLFYEHKVEFNVND